MNILGVLVVVVGGVSAGLFTAPLAYVKGWQWENSWLIYTIYAMVFSPWIFVFFALDHVPDIYSNAPTHAIVMALVFGFVWGIGSVTFGLGVKAVGNALGFAIILGLTSAIGAALPLVVLHPEDVGSREGIFTWIGLGIVICGLYVLAKAGQRKEADLAKIKELMPLIQSQDDEVAAKPSFVAGLVICIISGLFSPCLNLAIAFGSDLGKEAEHLGNGKTFSDNATWTLAVGAGMITNAAYCIYLLNKNQTWGLFMDPTLPLGKNAALGALSGLLWFGGNTVYTVGGEMIGSLGTVIGWPVFMISMIAASNVFGLVKGEWKGTSTRARTLLAVGLFILCGAVVFIALG
eukprot:TRINITY_DN11623_c0_g1_i6.p1 TRINITY_DN11623_c0_g1~~TRINITY_DN11623_c0_g1_i6.p1  ORF type:complete len:348 (+),score=37.33 TRINITY_DN11623_c0_g1_i6:194-1237(+)